MNLAASLKPSGSTSPSGGLDRKKEYSNEPYFVTPVLVLLFLFFFVLSQLEGKTASQSTSSG
jgi:hypothetical protein